MNCISLKDIVNRVIWTLQNKDAAWFKEHRILRYPGNSLMLALYALNSSIHLKSACEVSAL